MATASNDWVDDIHGKLLIRYGAQWARMWEGINPDAVRDDWAGQLAGISEQRIEHALQHLPIERPPTAGQFRLLCMSLHVTEPQPMQQAPLLEGPTVDHEAVAQRLRAAQERFTTGQSNDPKAWARKLRDIELSKGGILDSGKPMTKFQRDAWREALKQDEARGAEHDEIV